MPQPPAPEAIRFTIANLMASIALLGALVTLGVTWGTYANAQASLDTRVTHQEQITAEMVTKVHTIETTVARIETLQGEQVKSGDRQEKQLGELQKAINTLLIRIPKQ